jgi:DNA repair protein RadA/Sms
MNDDGLSEVVNPSAMLLSGRAVNVSGSSITCILEGSRPILAEVQALTTQTGFGNPRRVSTGFDFNRLNLLLAILEKRIGIKFSAFDAYLNITGGLRLDEPAADLAVALSLVSAFKNVPIDADTIVFGEVGLSGELRSVPRIEARINEAERLGFKTCILPRSSALQIKGKHNNIELLGVNSLAEAIALIN